MTAGPPKIEATIMRIIREQTLYDDDELALDADLEGELGIDSVLLESVLADVRDTLSLPDGALSRGRFTTLRQLIGAVVQVAPEAAGEDEDAPAEPAAPAAEQTPLTTRVMATFRTHTMYEDDELAVDADLEGELGIDSVILTSVLADLEEALELPDGRLVGRSFATIRDVIDAIGGVAPASKPAPAKAAAAQAPKPAAAKPPASATDDIQRLPAPRSMQKAPAPAPAPKAPELTPDDAPIGDTAGLRSLIERITGRPLGDLGDDRPLQLAGLTTAERNAVFGAIEGHLGRATVRLEDCDTVEKLQRYVQAADPHALKALTRPDPSRPTSDAPSWDGRTMKDFVELRDKDLFAKTRAFGDFYRQQQRNSLYWYGMASESPCRNRIVIYDEVAGRRREFLNFASNNYLGLANDPRVTEAIGAAAKKYGATNTGCRIIGGTTALHKELERRLAAFKQRPACIVYPGGYSANIGCISALVKRHDAVIVDKYNHMSIVDGCNLSGGQRKIYQHDDMDDLERVLERTAPKVDGMLIATDGVFSMHGNICQLDRIVELAKRYGAKVLVDDAHSTGVLGKTGAGTAEHFGLKGQVDLELGTMSKTLAGLGGFVVGEEEVIDYLRFYSNSYVFAATIPAPVAAGLIASIDLIEQEPERQQNLWRNIKHLQGNLDAAGFDTGGAESAIVPIVIGDDEKTLLMGREVRAAGLFCQTVVYPGVSVGDARLRISVTAEHTPEDIELATEIFVDAGRRVGVLPPTEV